MDNVWSNLEITSTELIEGLDGITDHSVISVKLRIDENVKRIIPHKTFSFYANSDIRKMLMTDPSVKTILKDPNSLQKPLRP